MNLHQLPFGKRLPNATYIARESLERLGGVAWQRVLDACRRAACDPAKVSVIKWHHNGGRIGLLHYPGFLVEAHPALDRAILVAPDGTVRETVYGPDADPPILHRCELLIESDHPLHAALSALTRLEERYGLYADPSRIGMRSHWQALLAEKGLRIRGMRLELDEHVPRPAGKPVSEWQSERQRTAIVRTTLSLPPRLLLQHGLLKAGDRYLDYGCGRGGDLPLLAAMGILAHGWDPAHRPRAPLIETEVVHLGYVLNVVEDPDERLSILHDAWKYAIRLLSVAVRVHTENTSPSGVSWGDGVMTRSGTFQRYYAPGELAEWMESVLCCPVLSLAPGIVVVARDPAILHEAMAAKVRSPVTVIVPTLTPDCVTDSISATEQPQRVKIKHNSYDSDKVAPASSEVSGVRRQGTRQRQVSELLDQVGPLLRELGRAPRREEWPGHPIAEALGMGPLQVWNAFAQKIGPSEVEALRQRRRDDTLVFLAMAHFRRVPKQVDLPLRTRIDIEELLGGYRAAVSAARACLSQAGDPDIVTRLCDATRFGVRDRQALYVHTSLIPRLHPVLRCLIGCAEVLGAPVAQAQIVKIHAATRKVTLLVYQDFDTSSLPALVERIKVDLRACRVFVFDHRAQPRQLLYGKDLYIADDDPRQPVWRQESERLERLIGPICGRGPDHIYLRDLLTRAGADPDAWVPENLPAPQPDDADDYDESYQCDGALRTEP